MTDRADKIFAGALADLASRLGVRVEEMEPGEIAALVRACDREADPWRETTADAAGVPVRVCEGIYFWKLTIGAAAWLEDVAAPVVRDNGRYRLCLIHALVHAREPEAFRDLDTEPKIRRAALDTALRISATPEEVDLAIERALGLRTQVRSDDETKDAAVGWASIAARLETQTGIPAAEWIWHRSSSYAMKCYMDLHAFARAYSGRGGGSDRLVDELDAAVVARQKLKVKIAQRVKKSREACHGDD